MKPFLHFFTESATHNLHLVHIEDGILTDGLAGAQTALDYLQSLATPPRGGKGAGNTLRVKSDGIAFIAGFDPITDQFFVGTKSVFNKKTPKVNYTKEDIQTNHGDKPGLVKKLEELLMYLPEIIKSGIYQGDFLFDHSDLRMLKFQGKSYVCFNPNTIYYAIQDSDPLAEQIKKVKIGIAIHSEYQGNSLDDLSVSLSNVTSFKTTENVYIMKTLFDEQERFPDAQEIVQTLQQAKEWLKKIPPEEQFLTSQVRDSLMTFRNELVRKGIVNDLDASQMLEELRDWIQQQKTTKKIQAGETFVQNNRENLLNVFQFIILLNQAKMMIVTQIDERMKKNPIKTLVHRDGNFVETAPEGYVLSNPKVGQAFKLVNRAEFSKDNFANTRWDQ